MANDRILVVGSINMDVVARVDRLPRPGETVAGLDIAYMPGGKGANQAVAASRLGAQVRMVGCVGDDGFGRELRHSLDFNGVDQQFVRTCERTASGAAMIFVENGGQNVIAVVAGANDALTPADLEADEVWADVHVVLLQLESPLATVAAAVEISHRRGVLCIFDPAPTPTAGLTEQLLHVDVLTPNQSEAQSLTGVMVESIAEAQDAARVLRQRGVRNVVVKLGEFGAYWLGPDDRGLHVPAPQIEALDTTAAGDAFNGALGVGLVEGRPFEEALRFACAAGSLACTRRGAQAAMPTRLEVDARLERGGGAVR